MPQKTRSPHRADDGTDGGWSGVAAVRVTRPALGLNLCDPTELLNRDERVELERDLTDLAQGRRDAEAASGSIRLS